MNRQNRHKPRVNNSICRGLWVPQEILNIPAEDLSWLGKLVCGRIGSYGAKGCYESNATLARYFGVSLRQMKYVAAQIRSLPLTYSIKVRGVSVCYWLRCSAEVQQVEWLNYRGLSMRNPAYDQCKYCTGVVQETAPVPVQKTAPNNKTTRKTTGAASPSPADGQAQRRKKEKADAWRKVQSHIWAEIVRHLPFVPVTDQEAKVHQLAAIAEFKDRAELLVQDGMSVDDAVKRVLGKKYVKAREESL